ncbi:MAG: Cd(II)/Pb(II)-responsive transcriptional regulator [Burkholderiales bacterium]|nr:Cd(II)/Pb(II)-responsive transcriptional regulator [Burkholderiales bacterium]
MRIGELAARAGVDVQTLRYYEREGLLDPPARTRSGYRSYAPAHLERLNFIRHCRSLDMALADVRRLLELSKDKSASCDEVNAKVHAHLERVRAKRAALQVLERQLAALDAQCASGHRVADCGILEELIHAAHGEACACHAGPAAGAREVSAADRWRGR